MTTTPTQRYRELLGLLLLVFAIESGTMLAIFHWLPLSLPHWQTALLDASILTLTCLPFLWRFQLQPLRAALNQQKDRAQAVMETAADSILTMDTAGRIESINPAAERLFGYKRDELVGQSMSLLVPAELYGPHDRHIQTYVNGGGGRVIGRTTELFAQRRDGTTFPIELTVSEIKTDTLHLFTGVVRDISQRKAIERQLRENIELHQASEQNLRALLDATSETALLIDTNGQIISINKTGAERFNSSPQDMASKNVFDFMPADIASTRRDRVAEVMRTGQSLTHVDERDGRTVRTTLYPVFDSSNQVVRLAVYGADITEQQANQERIAYLAYHDALTDLPNRTLFFDRLRQAIFLAQRDRRGMALLYLDLDKFKPVNDELGHDHGDLLLREVAQRLRHCVRTSDTVARLGGDEFTVILPAGSEPVDAIRVGEKILAALTLPVVLPKRTVHVGASIGIALYPQHGTSPDELTHSADQAMYRAKRTHGVVCVANGGGPEAGQ